MLAHMDKLRAARSASDEEDRKFSEVTAAALPLPLPHPHLSP